MSPTINHSAPEIPSINHHQPKVQPPGPPKSGSRVGYQLDTGRIWDYASDVFVHRRLVQHAAMGHFELALPAPAMEESRGSKVWMGWGMEGWGIL